MVNVVAKNRCYEIDFLRFTAAMCVVFFHYTFRGYAADDRSILPFIELGSIFKYGHLGVDLFFMISGFVILMTALNNNCTGFVISRITRLYPTFWISVTLTTIVTVFIGGIRHHVSIGQYLINLTMLHQIVGVESVDGVYWTLLVELKFYFIISCILMSNQMSRIRFILGLWMIALLYISFLGAPKVVKVLIFPEWAYYFIAGAAFYLVRLEGISIYNIAIIILSFVLSLKGSSEKITVFQNHYHVEVSKYIISGLIASFYAVFYLISTNKLAFLNKKMFLKYGALTYPLYLIHQNIGFMGFNYFGEVINKYVLLAVTIGLILCVAYLITVLVDKKVTTPVKNSLRSVENFIINRTKQQGI